LSVAFIFILMMITPTPAHPQNTVRGVQQAVASCGQTVTRRYPCAKRNVQHASNMPSGMPKNPKRTTSTRQAKPESRAGRANRLTPASGADSIMPTPLPSPSHPKTGGLLRQGTNPVFAAFWMSLIALVMLMFIGSGDRVLVFANFGDLGWTAGVVFIPLAALFLVPLTAGMMLPKDAPMMSWRMVIDYPLYAVTVALIGAGWVYSLLVTIVRPIMFNGWFLGLIVAALKLFTATLLAILVFAVWTLWMNEHRQKRRPNRALIATMFAVLGWIAVCLINGDRVFERRYQQSA
jgi:hypothetical protein